MFNCYLTKSQLKTFIIIWTLLAFTPSQNIQAQEPVRRINAPYFSGNVPSEQAAIFWFGDVYNSSNYADVRVGYNDNELKLTFHIVDRRLWYDKSPTIDTLTEWDAATLYLHLKGNNGAKPTPDTYRFVGQLVHWQARHNYQVAYQGDGSNWLPASIPFTTTSNWRGDGPLNDIDDKGWWLKFQIPFTSLGLSGPPPPGTEWGLALAVHDRDDAANTPIPDQTWPEIIDPLQPKTWSELVFSQPSYHQPQATPDQVVTIRHGLNGATVTDAHVGGHGNCGEGIDHWTEWGEANYADYARINIQNQWDISDYPCFSKYYVTFPLDTLPSNKEIISATLTMHLFGNAGYRPGQAQPSLIQAFTVGEDWNEATISWNNAPLVSENVAGTWVYPVVMEGERPYHWDISRAVAEAYTARKPLSLALYSADGEYHSGKYFWSSDVDDWNATRRPAVNILLGDKLLNLNGSKVYLPAIMK